jgi:aromatic-L-amino-acid decarboxylase
VTPEDFKRRGHELIDWIADYVENIERQRVTSEAKPGDVRAQLDEHPPATPDGFEAVMRDLDAVVVPGLTHWQHPNFFAYFPANSSYPAILGDLVTAGLGVQGMSWVTSPACTEVETLMVDWMHELLALPEHFRSTSASGGGVIHGSASEATLASILAARWRATDGAVNTDGDSSRLVAYATSQAHSSIEKGLRIAGIGTDRLRVVPHDASFAMQPDALSRMVADDRQAGLVPVLGVFDARDDELDGVRPDCRHRRDRPSGGHVAARRRCDERYRRTGSGASLGQQRPRVRRQLLHQPAQVDGHQLRLRPVLDVGPQVAARRAEHLPEYLRSQAAESGAVIDYRDWQVPLGRRFRSLKLWFHLRIDGVEPVQEMIREHVGLTQLVADLAAADERFEIVAPHPLNLVCVALRDGDAATDQLIERANATGNVLFTRTVLDGGPCCGSRSGRGRRRNGTSDRHGRCCRSWRDD